MRRLKRRRSIPTHRQDRSESGVEAWGLHSSGVCLLTSCRKRGWLYVNLRTRSNSLRAAPFWRRLDPLALAFVGMLIVLALIAWGLETPGAAAETGRLIWSVA